MKIARIKIDGQQTVYALVEDQGYRLIEGSPWEKWRATDSVIAASRAALLAPVQPPQIVAIGRNYREHAAETLSDVPTAPLIFIKTINCVIGPGDAVVLPAMAPNEVDYEAELAIVIGKEAKNVPEERAYDYILGFTCGIDVSARDCQLRIDKQWARGKCFDTFLPLGPWIATGLDGNRLAISMTINGQTLQDSNTSQMIFPCRYLVSYVSRCMTLYPGSIIMTGTPGGVGMGRKPPRWLAQGDVMTVEIEGIGALTNPVRNE